jgi:gluconolactonase
MLTYSQTLNRVSFVSEAAPTPRELICEDLRLPEGPVLRPEGSWVVTELALARGCVTAVDEDGRRTELARTGRPNGLALTADGTLWIAESLQPSILALSPAGDVRTVATDPRLLWPNDICVGREGSIFATDSGVLVRDFLIADVARSDLINVKFDGKVVRVGPSDGEIEWIDKGIDFANGIAFGPDRALYVNETMTGNVYRYAEPGAGARRELFANVLAPDWKGSGLRGPDGMAFDRDGYLYVAVFGQGDVTVISPAGEIVNRIPCGGNAPTNVAFGPQGSGYFVVTEDEHGTLERYPVAADGLPLHE